MKTVPQERIDVLNQCEVASDGEYVLYWMVATRRIHFNPALHRAVELAEELGKPLLVFEAVSTRHKFASDRIITFMVQGMVENIRGFESRRIRYIPWVSTPLQSGEGLLHRLALRACAVITDSFPTYHPRYVVESVKSRLEMRFEAVDGNGILPMSSGKKAFPTAHAFRRHVHDSFADYWNQLPEEMPIPNNHNLWIEDDLFQTIVESSNVELTPFEWLWRVAQGGSIGTMALSALDIDHEVTAPPSIQGGRTNALLRLNPFLDDGLHRYHLDLNSFVRPCLLYTSPSPRDRTRSRMPSSA